MSITKISAETEQLRAERDLAIKFLAQWCAAVTGENTCANYWKNVFFETMHGEHAIRGLLDESIEREFNLNKAGE